MMNYIKLEDYNVIEIYNPKNYEQFLQIKNIDKRKKYLEIYGTIAILEDIKRNENNKYIKIIIDMQIKELTNIKDKIFDNENKEKIKSRKWVKYE